MDVLDNVVVWLSVGAITGLSATYILVLLGKQKPKYLTLSSIGFGVLVSFVAPECMCSNYKDWLVGTILVSGVLCIVFSCVYVGFFLAKNYTQKT